MQTRMREVSDLLYRGASARGERICYFFFQTASVHHGCMNMVKTFLLSHRCCGSLAQIHKQPKGSLPVYISQSVSD